MVHLLTSHPTLLDNHTTMRPTCTGPTLRRGSVRRHQSMLQTRVHMPCVGHHHGPSAPLFDIRCSGVAAKFPTKSGKQIVSAASLPSPLRSAFKVNL
jgi:hypothetical protein